MKINKKITLIALACVVVGAAALFAFHNGSPAESGTPTVSGSSQAPDANVNNITSPEPGKEIDPPAISSSSDSKATPDVIDPEKEDTNITVPLTDPVQKPPADTEKHKKDEDS